ncbi:MAG: tyrosine-protein phosphatase [Actinomycetota bacterium]
MIRPRVVPVEGAMNLRDLGGYPTPIGPTRHDVAFRSDNLASLTDADLEILAGIGLRSIIDFRREQEVERDRSRVPTTVEHRLHLPIGGHASHQVDWVQLMLDGEITEYPVSEVVAGYREMMTEHARTFGVVVTHVAADDTAPTLFHCTAGKDRTGAAALLLLGLVGVPRQHLVDDYLLSNELRAIPRMRALAPRFEERGVDIERFRPMFSAPPEAIEAALALIDEVGGFERYATDLAGVDVETIAALRSRLVHPT